MKGFKKQLDKNIKEVKPESNADDLPEKVPGNLKVIGRLKPEEYWEWRTTVEELMHAATKTVVSERNIQIKSLELALVRRDCTEAKRQAELAKVEYGRLKLVLEKKHDLSLSETVISSENFEIRVLKNEDE